MIELRDLWLIIIGPMILILVYMVTRSFSTKSEQKTDDNEGNNKPNNKTNNKPNNRFNDRSRGRNNSGGDGRKKRDKIIKEVQASLIKHIAVIDGLSLLVGALGEKVKKFGTNLNHISTEISDIKSELDRINLNFSTIEVMKKDNNTKFVNIHKNFSMVENSLNDFEKELKILRDAIFIPDVSDDDSEFSENIENYDLVVVNCSNNPGDSNNLPQSDYDSNKK